jgi:hypothetical protein
VLIYKASKFSSHASYNARNLAKGDFMPDTIVGQPRTFGKLIIQCLLISGLTTLSVLTIQAQSSKESQLESQGPQPAQTLVASNATANTVEQKGGKGNKAKVTFKRVNQITLSAAAIKTLRSVPVFNKAITISGNTIAVREGSSLWQVSGGGHALVAGSTDEPMAAERWEKEMGDNIVYVCGCACPNTSSENDKCEFDGMPTIQNCKGECGRGCKFTDGLLYRETGVMEYFRGPG